LLNKPITNLNGVFSSKTCYTGVRSGKADRKTDKEDLMAELDAYQEKVAADRKANKEKMKADIEAWQEKIAAETEVIKARTRAI
jgi:peptidoglycan hydrolase CwlO-like protein